MMKYLRHFKMSKAQRNGLFILIVLIIIVEFGFHLLKFQNSSESKELTAEELAWLNENSTEEKFSKPLKISYKIFNPNQYTKKDWEKIGFSEKQSEIILKYKYSLGGNFKTLNEIKNCFVISEEKFQELKPYIQLNPLGKNYIQNKPEYKKKSNNFPTQAFNPNQLNLQGWMKLDFSEKQAKVILKYKKSVLGGRFSSLEEIKNCYVINEEKFQALKPYIILPNNEGNSLNTTAKNTAKPNNKISKGFKNFEDKNVNSLTLEDWINLGANSDQAKNILKYKEFIQGFKSEEDLSKCEFISEEIIKNIKKSQIII